LTTLPSTSITDADEYGVLHVRRPFLPYRNKVSVKRGKWAKYLKLAFERYYVEGVRHYLPSLDFGW
jgi:hypothetical protein